MNETQQSNPCTGMTCPGASCGCGCQNASNQDAAEAAIQAACACGAQCPCGLSCSCAKA